MDFAGKINFSKYNEYPDASIRLLTIGLRLDTSSRIIIGLKIRLLQTMVGDEISS